MVKSVRACGLALVLNLCPKAAHAWLTCRDCGHGMDASTRDRIFEPCFTTKPIEEGGGLGRGMREALGYHVNDVSDGAAGLAEVARGAPGPRTLGRPLR